MTITVTITDASREADLAAALHIVNQENAKRESAATDEEPAVLLPVETTKELKASYEAVLADTLGKAHISYQNQAAEAEEKGQGVRKLWKAASAAQRSNAVAALQSK